MPNVDTVVLSLPEAIKKMTSLPTQEFRLQTKGISRRGFNRGYRNIRCGKDRR